jgi:prepilin-type N-terminal cleavage/methylation domain-containing protein
MKTARRLQLLASSRSTQGAAESCALKAAPLSRGFTLVEMLVAVAIFSMVMLIAVGSLLSLIDSNHKAQTIKSAVNNLSFALDGVARASRVGNTFHCGTSADAGSAAVLSTAANCASGGTLIAFEPYGGSPGSTADQWVYCRGNGTACSDSGTSILRSKNGGASYESITSPEVVLEDLRFYVAGALSGSADRLQPKIVMVLRGYAGSSLKTRTQIRLQTTLTPRLLDE